MHIDIDPAEIHKNKAAHVPVCADVRPALQMLNRLLAEQPLDQSQVGAPALVRGKSPPGAKEMRGGCLMVGPLDNPPPPPYSATAFALCHALTTLPPACPPLPRLPACLPRCCTAAVVHLGV